MGFRPGAGWAERDSSTTRRRCTNSCSEWNDLANEFRTDIAHAEVIARAQGPGLEYASGGNAELVRASGQSLSETLKQRASYCESMADKYATALGKYATAEETHAAEIGNTTKGTL